MSQNFIITVVDSWFLCMHLVAYTQITRGLRWLWWANLVNLMLTGILAAMTDGDAAFWILTTTLCIGGLIAIGMLSTGDIARTRNRVQPTEPAVENPVAQEVQLATINEPPKSDENENSNL